MKTLDKKDRILITTLKNILRANFGNIIISIHCYGSRITRGNKDSDFDILILTEKQLNWKEQRKIKNSVYEYGIENDLVFDPKIFSYYEFENKFSFLPFVQNVKATGIVV